VIFKYMLSNSPVFLFVMSASLLAAYGLARLLLRAFRAGQARARGVNTPPDRR